MYESIHVRITKEQYEWLRRHCFESRTSQAEVVREALDMFRNQKEVNENGRPKEANCGLPEQHEV